MVTTIHYKTVWSVCTHYKITPKPLLTSQQLREGQDGIRIARKRPVVSDNTSPSAADDSVFPFCCAPYKSTEPPEPARMTTDVVYGWCDRCVEFYKPFSRNMRTELRTEAAVLGFWSYKARYNIATAVEPGHVSPTAFLIEPGRSRRAAREETRRRVECLALAAALRRNTTKRVDEMVEIVEYVRMETLRWAAGSTWPEQSRQMLAAMRAANGEYGVPQEGEDEGEGEAEGRGGGVINEQPRRLGQMPMQMPGMSLPATIPPPPQRALPALPPRVLKKRKLEADDPPQGCSDGGPPKAAPAHFACIDWNPSAAPAAPAAAVLDDSRQPSIRRKPLPPNARLSPAASMAVVSQRKLTKRLPTAESKAQETTQASHVISDTDGTIPFMMLPHTPPPPSKPEPSPPARSSSTASSLSVDTSLSYSRSPSPQQRDYLVPSSSKQIKDLFCSEGSSEVSGVTSEASSVMQYPDRIDAICKKEEQKKKDEKGETGYGGTVATKVGEAEAGQHAAVMSPHPNRSPNKAGMPLLRQSDAVVEPHFKHADSRAESTEKRAATLNKQAATLKKEAATLKKQAASTKKRAEPTKKRVASTISRGWLGAIFPPIGPY